MENKKICIVTWYKVANYGAFLQAYAMKKILEGKGYEVFFYNYERKLLQFNQYNLIKHPIKTVFRKFFKKQTVSNAEFYTKKDKIFDLEISNYFNKACLDDVYSLCIIGSDEIFNIESGFNSFQFTSPVKAKKTISYAASFGETSIQIVDFYKLRKTLQDSLSEFAGISVRDENSKCLAEILTDKTVSINIDPVLFYGFENECATMKARKTEPYIIFYAYDTHFLKKEHINAILSFAHEKKMKIISCGYYHPWCDENINCSPFDFISYIFSSGISSFNVSSSMQVLCGFKIFSI